MARKVKHIIAKLLGSSTEETLDVYDVDAVHKSDVTTSTVVTEAGKVLDARAGKTLRDLITAETERVNNTILTSIPIVQTIGSDANNAIISGRQSVTILSASGFKLGRHCHVAVRIKVESEITDATNVALWRIRGTDFEPLSTSPYAGSVCRESTGQTMAGTARWTTTTGSNGDTYYWVRSLVNSTIAAGEILSFFLDYAGHI